MLGMNDASYRPFDQAIFDTYANGYRHIVETAQGEAARRPAHADPALAVRRRDPAAEVRGRLQRASWSATASSSRSWPRRRASTVADLNTSVVEATRKAERDATPSSPRSSTPTASTRARRPAAHGRGAAEAWNAPAIVSDGRRSTRRRRPRNGPPRTPRSPTSPATTAAITWTQDDAALPMPINLKDPADRAGRPLLRRGARARPADRSRSTGAEAAEVHAEDRRPGRSAPSPGSSWPTASTWPSCRPRCSSRRPRSTADPQAQQHPLQPLAERPGPVPGREVAHLAKAIDGLDALEADLVKQQRAAAAARAAPLRADPAAVTRRAPSAATVPEDGASSKALEEDAREETWCPRTPVGCLFPN